MTLSAKLDQVQGEILEMLAVMEKQTCNLGSLSRIIALAYTRVGRTLDGLGSTLDHLDRTSLTADPAYIEAFQMLQKIYRETEKTNRYLREVGEPYFNTLERQQRALHTDVHAMFWQLQSIAERDTEEHRQALA